jgi:hypothetical protein
VTNDAATPTEIQLLYHINIGQPLLGAGSRVVAPLKTLAPRDARAAEDVQTWDLYGPEQAGFAEQVYFAELAADAAGETHVLLKNATGSQGLSLRYPVRQLPYFVLWKNTGAVADGYVTGLEPATNLPNQRSYEGTQGRVIKLAPGESVKFELELTAYPDKSSVAEAEAAVAELQHGTSLKIHETPKAGWSPGA